MNCRIEEIDTFGRKLHIDIPAADFNEQINLKLRKISTTVKIKGFRPGKAPIEVINRYYGSEIRAEAANNLMYQSYKDALEQHSFSSLVNPFFEDMQIDQDKGISYTVYIEVMPDLQLNALEDVTIEEAICEIEETDTDAMVERVRKNHVKWQEKNGPACIDDRVTLDMSRGKSGDASTDILTDKSYMLGSNLLGKYFDEQLENMRAGEEKEVKLESTADKKTAASDGGDRRYKVRIKLVEKEILPELDDDFFKACNIKEGGLDALRSSLREGMEWELKKKLLQLRRANIGNALLKHSNIKAPPTMLKEQIESIRKKLSEDNSNKNPAKKDVPDKFFEGMASRQVCLNILFLHFIKKYKMQADRPACEAKIEELSEGYADSENIKNYYRSDANAYQEIEAMVLEDKIMGHMAEKMNTTKKKYSFDELMNLKAETEIENKELSDEPA